VANGDQTEELPDHPPEAPSVPRHRRNWRLLGWLPVPALILAVAIVAVNLVGDPPRPPAGDHAAARESVGPPVTVLRSPSPASAVATPSGRPGSGPSRSGSAPPPSGPPASPGRSTVQQTIRYEAEQATLSGAAVESGYIAFVASRGAFAQWPLRQPVAGRVTLRLRYANGDRPDRPLQIAIDGRSVTQVDFLSTGDWSAWRVMSVVVTLPAGTGTIRVSTTSQHGGPNLDYLEVAP
jgi:hypothetical protein